MAANIINKPETDDLQTNSNETRQPLAASDDAKISLNTLRHLLPFHLLVDKNLLIIQSGISIEKCICPKSSTRLSAIDQKNFESSGHLLLTDLCRFVEPELPQGVSYGTVLAHSKCPFVLELRRTDGRVTATTTAQSERTSPEIANNQCARTQGSHRGDSVSAAGVASTDYASPNSVSARTTSSCLTLVGHVVCIEETHCLLFVMSPRVFSTDDLELNSLTLSDIPRHDPAHDLIAWNDQLRQKRLETIQLIQEVEAVQRNLSELEREKSISDQILYSILPRPVADQLKDGPSVKAVRYESASILFCGICEFLEFCLNRQPMDVVNLLDILYSQFDSLAEHPARKVYKVETVGDKYMLVSGLPGRNADHAESIVLTALDMLDIGRRMSVNGSQIRLIVGVHSGEVVAGVVGQRMPHFAVFGVAVCQASRMESTGLPEKVNISEDTYQYIRTKESSLGIVIAERGLLQMKGFNKPIKCYILNRR